MPGGLAQTCALAGVPGWRLQRPELHGCYAGVNVTKLELRRRPHDA